MTDLMHERGCDPIADHPLARHPDDRYRAALPAGKPRPRPADRRAGPAVQVADDRWWIEISRQRERVCRERVEPREPHPIDTLTALRDRVREDLELRDDGVEA